MESGDISNTFSLNEIGSLKNYCVDWYNALTGAFLQVQEYSSGILGNLELSFPGTLTGNATSPILFFTVTPAGTSFKSAQTDSTKVTKILIDDLKIDNTVDDIVLTNWNTNNNFTVNVNPNPTTAKVNITITGTAESAYQWILTDADGNILKKNNVILPNFDLDLAVYKSGTYYITVYSDSEKQTVKIVKL